MNEQVRAMVTNLRLGLARLEGVIDAEPSTPLDTDESTLFTRVYEMQQVVAHLVILTRGIVVVLEGLTADE
jgi:hypothetical protein